MPTDSVENLLDRGWQQYQSGELEQAGRSYQQVLDQQPDHANCLFLMGILENRRGREEAAHDCFARAAQAEPDNLDVLNALGIASRKIGRLQDALESYRRALRLAPDDPAILVNYGVALAEDGDLEAAARQYRHALAAGPELAEAHNNLGNALRLSGDLAGAQSAYEKALAINHDYPDAHKNIAAVFRVNGAYDRALPHLKQVAALQPTAASSVDLGILQMMNKDYAEATRSFEYALTLDALSPTAHFALGLAQRREQLPEKAITSFRHAIALKPNHVGAWFNLGAMLWNESRDNEAIETFEELLRLDPKNVIAKHTINALRGQTTDAPPEVYVANLFNEYADRFEDDLVTNLGYRVPEVLRNLYDGAVADALPRFQPATMLDLGCGTGLVAEKFFAVVDSITGVDIAANMIEEAKSRGRYTQLHNMEITKFLSQAAAENRQFKIVTAADVFISCLSGYHPHPLYVVCTHFPE